MARVIVLMWGFVLTWFDFVLFFCTPAKTWAAVYVEEAGTAAEAAGAEFVVAAPADLIASGATSASAAAATTTKRVRGDDMTGGPSNQSLVKLANILKHHG
ncbi:MAG TPA: hypothetical protein VGN81_19390 [Pseudonocardiaceae bacterium]|jgi:hypothetical protein